MSRGPAPKPAHLRQRRNRKSTAATLGEPDITREVPELVAPDGREWHPMTLAWWARVWQSPMALEYLPTDEDGLGRLALIIDDFHVDPSQTKLMQEIRLQEARFGLSPVDRARLHWEVDRGEQAEQKRKRRKAPAPKPDAKDPRSVLRAVK